MDYVTWEKHRDELHNEDMRPLCKLSKEAQEAMKEAAGGSALIEMLVPAGTWSRTGEPSWYQGFAYRVSPNWPGPAKPEPVEECETLLVYAGNDGHWRVKGSNVNHYLSTVHGHLRFAGYVYEIDGKERCRARLLFDPHPDGTFRLRVPKAVRFVKGAA